MVCANFIEARRTHILRKQAGYMEAILSLSFGLLSLAKREETIYGTWMSQNLSRGSDTLEAITAACATRPPAFPGVR